MIFLIDSRLLEFRWVSLNVVLLLWEGSLKISLVAVFSLDLVYSG